MRDIYRASKFWEDINLDQLSFQNIKNIKDFKSSPSNFRLAYWDPSNNGVRYFKFLIYNLSSLLTPDQLRKITKSKIEIGNPISITYKNTKISMDGLLSLYEAEFIGNHLNINNKTVLEIGAGYGRTADFLLSNYNVKKYVIVDLDNSIKLSQRYLKKTLSKSNFLKVEFISANKLPAFHGKLSVDLCLNANSFAEMDKDVVYNYLSFINQHAKYFYVRNPLGKYLDKSLDNHFRGSLAVKRALQLGVLRDIIDVYNSDQVERQSAKFLKAYQPGKQWLALGSDWAKPWSFYWQALYVKK